MVCNHMKRLDGLLRDGNPSSAKVCQGLSSYAAICHVVLTRHHSSNLNMESKNLRLMHLRRKVVKRVEIIITE